PFNHLWFKGGVKRVLFTLGHSNQTFEAFLGHLKAAQVQTIVDVRTVPFSRRFPWFSQQKLAFALSQNGIDYVFMGRELGGRPEEEKYYTDGIANYQKMARSPSFGAGINKVLELAKTRRLALLCSEGDPLHCHRMLLVSRE